MGNHDEVLSVLPVIHFGGMLFCSSPKHISCEEFSRAAKKLQSRTLVIVAVSANDHHDLYKDDTVDKIINKPFTLQDSGRKPLKSAVEACPKLIAFAAASRTSTGPTNLS